MIVCGVKTDAQELLVMVWILTGTMMITGVRFDRIKISFQRRYSLFVKLEWKF